MNYEIVEKYKPVICKDLYEAGAKEKTIRYKNIFERYNQPHWYPELFVILDEITREEYVKNGIFIAVLAVRDRGPCLPTKGRPPFFVDLAGHGGLSFEDICKREKQRVFEFIRKKKEKERLKRWPPHNLF